LDLAIAEHESSIGSRSHERFVKSGIDVKDVYGTLGGWMQPAVFDSSIYVTALQRGDDAVLALRRFAN